MLDGCNNPEKLLPGGHISSTVLSRQSCLCIHCIPFLQEKLLIREGMHADSVVILTSRSTALLCKYCNHVHEVSLLPLKLAKQLFAGYAFGSEQPSEAMRERATAIVASCGGLPLAIEVSVGCLTADGRI